MKIAHLCLSNFYIDGASYQENELIAQHVRTGHDVVVIASTENYGPDGKMTYVEPSVYEGKDGAVVHRLAYHFLLPGKLGRKLRVHRGVYGLLEKYRPDVMLFHGLCGWELLTAAYYKRRNPGTLFYADNHTDWNNSARNFVSREILHKIYFRAILQHALPYIQMVLCISTETLDFAETVYGVKRNKLEFFPLAGHPVPENMYILKRKNARDGLGVGDGHVVFVQTGRQTKRKKLIESLIRFAATPDPQFRLFVAGLLCEDVREDAEKLIAQDERVKFLGWRSADEMTELLCAADVYLQPGTQSVTMQSSLCARCAVVIDDVPAHQPYIDGNGWLIGDEGYSLASIFRDISARKEQLVEMGMQSYLLASRTLDYAVLANRVLR